VIQKQAYAISFIPNTRWK